MQLLVFEKTGCMDQSFNSYPFEFMGKAVGAKLPGTLFNRRSRVSVVVKNGGLEWTVKVRRVRLKRCVFRYGQWDGMT